MERKALVTAAPRLITEWQAMVVEDGEGGYSVVYFVDETSPNLLNEDGSSRYRWLASQNKDGKMRMGREAVTEIAERMRSKIHVRGLPVSGDKKEVLKSMLQKLARKQTVDNRTALDEESIAKQLVKMSDKEIKSEINALNKKASIAKKRQIVEEILEENYVKTKSPRSNPGFKKTVLDIAMKMFGFYN